MARDHLAAPGTAQLRAREAASAAAHARWCYTAALARVESRGMHRRLDATGLDPAFGHRLLVSGLDEIAVRPDRHAVTEREALAS